MLALLNEFDFEYRENKTYVIQEKTALDGMLTACPVSGRGAEIK